MKFIVASHVVLQGMVTVEAEDEDTVRTFTERATYDALGIDKESGAWDFTIIPDSTTSAAKLLIDEEGGWIWL